MYSVKDEKELLSGYPLLYQTKLIKPGAQTVLNSNGIIFEPYGDIVDEAYSH